MDKISIIVPCYNEEKTINFYYQAMGEVEEALQGEVEWEYIFINDGSTDKTLDELRRLSQYDSCVHYISFSRNFGKEAGIYAGLRHATGDYVGLMDVDLQDPPKMLVEMYHILKDPSVDYDCVGARRSDRSGEPKIRAWFSRQFYKLINKISDTEIVDGARDYRLMTRQMVDAILEVTEYNRFSKGIFSWVGFNTKYIPYENQERIVGETSWSFWELFQYALDGIIAFSEAPLNMTAGLGFAVFILAIIIAVFLVIRTLVFGNPTSGWTSTIVVILGLGGLQLFCLGVVGKYVGKTYLEAKNRPIYIIKETDNMKKGSSSDHELW